MSFVTLGEESALAVPCPLHFSVLPAHPSGVGSNTNAKCTKGPFLMLPQNPVLLNPSVRDSLGISLT